MSARDVTPEMLVEATWREHFRVARVMRCSEWADEYRLIAKGPEKGPWKTNRTKYLQEPMDCTDPESQIQRVVLMFATQLGKSEVLYNAILKRIHISPMDMMFVQPTLQDAKDHSSQRFTHTARAMPDVLERIAETRSRDETNTLLTKEIANGSATLYFSGANSARSLASKPLGFAACDEVDGYPLDVDGEGDPIGLIEERMSNFPARKLLLCSTPTVKDFSRIETEYLASDRRRYWVPCPHCNETQVLTWGASSEFGLKWLKDAGGVARPETAVYICKHCGATIQEHHKTDMLESGLWIPEKPGAGRGLVAGFHLSKLYSPLGWKSWPMLVEQWVKAQEKAKTGDASLLKTFINTSLAETWEEQGDKVQHHELSKRAEPYELGIIPMGGLLVAMGVDVQPDRLEARIWAWGRGEESWLVSRHIIYGDPNLEEAAEGSPWAALTTLRKTPVQHAAGTEMMIEATCIDTGGHNTQAVYVYCRAHAAEHVLAVKGSSIGQKAPLGKPSMVDVTWRGKTMPRGLKLWQVGVGTIKHLLYGRLRLETVGSGYIHLPKSLSETDEFAQMTAERLVTKYVKGHAKLEWFKPNHVRNEALDCMVYAYAAAVYLGLPNFKEGTWSKRAILFQPEVPPPPKAEKPEPAPEPRRTKTPSKNPFSREW